MRKTILLLAAVLYSIVSFAYSGGSGIETNPYLISSKADMEELATNVNVLQNKYLDVYFRLTRDLTDQNDTITTIIGNYSGTSSVGYFGGVFDGNGHEIAVKIITSNRGVGLFGYISYATVKNLGIAGNITAIYDATTNPYVGGVCGVIGMRGIISNCYNKSNISVYPISETNNSSTGIAGGIAGNLGSTYSKIINCYNTGNISARSNSELAWAQAGGITGEISGSNYSNGGTILNCYNTGKIAATALDAGNSIVCNFVGGISGRFSNVQNCFTANEEMSSVNSSGKFINRIGEDGEDRYINRIVGTSFGTLINNYALNTMRVNGIAVSNLNENSKNGKDTELTLLQNKEWLEAILHWDFENVWEIPENGGFPRLKWENKSGNSIDNINFDEELQNIRYYDLSGRELSGNKAKGFVIETGKDKNNIPVARKRILK